jgi:3-methyl-2-oxobutanoate hydroxymethyltransferase
MNNDPVTITTLMTMKQHGQRIACLTCYDASFAQLLNQAGIDVLLVGDSLGMVLQGHKTTIPVTMEHMVYHSACVSRGNQRALIMADLPFLSFTSPQRACDAAARLLGEGGAQMVKLEGGEPILDTVRHLSEFGVPVCGHLGLLPQSVNKTGIYSYRGKKTDEAEAIYQQALALQEAGASLLVLECVPATLAARITADLTIPTIGIGAGADCDGQVLVLHDMLGMNPHRPPRFSDNFLTGHDTMMAALQAYVHAVKTRQFPTSRHILA